jgi:hypothetical protein
MRRKRLEPNSPEAVAAILRRIDNMTGEELQHWIDKLSRAPEGVYDPWSDENWARSNGSALPRDRTDVEP